MEFSNYSRSLHLATKQRSILVATKHEKTNMAVI